jgi:hypothetical protein
MERGEPEGRGGRKRSERGREEKGGKRDEKPEGEGREEELEGGKRDEKPGEGS